MEFLRDPTGCVPLDSSVSMDVDASLHFPLGHKSVKTKRHPKETVAFLKKWLYDHPDKRFPSPKEKAQLAKTTNLTYDQIAGWFNHARWILNRLMNEYYGKNGSRLEDLTITREVLEAYRRNEYVKTKPFPKESVAILRKWLEDNPGKSFPTKTEKIRMAKEANLTYHQVTKWFYNVHDRIVYVKKRKEKYEGKSGNKPPQKAEVPTDILRKWVYEHRNNPYPTAEELEELVRQTNMNRSRVGGWIRTFRFRHYPETIRRRRNHFREHKNPTAFIASAMYAKPLKKPKQKTRGTQTEEFSSMPQSSEAKKSGIQILGTVCSEILQSLETKKFGLQVLGMVCSETLLRLNGGESTDPSSGSESCSSKM